MRQSPLVPRRLFALAGLTAAAVSLVSCGFPVRPSTPTTPTTARPSPAPTTPPGSGPGTMPSSALPEGGTARFTETSGRQSAVPMASVHFCSNTDGDSLPLDNAAPLPFASMRRIEVTRSDVEGTSNGKATLTVTLSSGQLVSGTVTSNCDFTGALGAGRLSVYPHKLAAIDFHPSGG